MSEVTPLKLEEAMANMLPPEDSMLYDGWLLRFNTGTSRNPNAVWPLYPGTDPVEAKVAFCEKQYADRGLVCHFRLTDGESCAVIEDALLHRGYAIDNPNHLLAMDAFPDVVPQITEVDLEGWLATIHDVDPDQHDHAIAMKRGPLSRIALPAWYGFVEHEGAPSSYGRAVQQGDLYQLAELWTAPALRSRGLGTRLIQGLLALGRGAGARTPFIPVAESNPGARRLYERLGFSRVYGFRYMSPQS